MTDAAQQEAGRPKPFEDAFITVESFGSPETDKRSAALKITFAGQNSSERAWAARDYLDGLVKADSRTPARSGGEVTRKAVEYRVRVACAKASGLQDGSPDGKPEQIVFEATDAILALIQAPLPGDLAGLDDYLWNQAEVAETIEGRVVLDEWRLGLRALSADNARLREQAVEDGKALTSISEGVYGRGYPRRVARARLSARKDKGAEG